MARLNDPPQPGQESFEAVKKRYIRQNREIARVNSTQSIRIRSLETETTRLLTENIDLREQVIKLQASLDRRERSKAVAENVEAAKTQLEGKVTEMQELLTSLGKALSLSPKGVATIRGTNSGYASIIAKPQPKQKAYIVSPEQRTWRRGLSFSEVMGTEDNLPAISEDSRSRRSSLNTEEPRRTSLGSESRRSSINFEEITLLPPRADDAGSDEDLKPPTSSMLDIRPRRRRDSSRPIDLEISRPAAPPKTQPAVDSSTHLEGPKRRRYEERDKTQDTQAPLHPEFKFTKLQQGTPTRQQVEMEKPILSTVTLNGSGYDTKPMNEDEVDETEKIAETGKRAVKMNLIEKDHVPPRETVISSATSTIGRRALGPTESTNADPSNSPLKQAAIKAALLKERDIEKLDKTELPPPPKMKAYRESNITEILPDAEPAASTGRPSRRSKANNVNYALPNLRDKMRREDKPNEGVKGEGKTSRRSTAGGRLKNKHSSEELIKQEGFCDRENIFGNQWLELPTLPHATTLAVDVEEPRKTREIGIGGLLEKRSSRENDGEMELPATVMTHRKRRSSNLHQGTLMDLENEATTERSQTTATIELRRKTVSFDPESTYGSEEAQSHNRTEGTNSRRKNSIHIHLPPSSHMDVLGEASLALNEAVRGSRRTTLGGGVRGARSTNNLNSAGGDETEVEDNQPAIATGIASRRRSMML